MNEQFANVAVPRLLIQSSFCLPPVEYSRGTSPSHAARSRAFWNWHPVPTAASSAVAPNAPIPGIVMSRRATSSRSAIAAISLVTSLMRCSNWRRSANRSTSSLRSSPAPSIRDGRSRCAMPKAPRQRRPSLHPPSRAQPTPERTQNWIETGGNVVIGNHALELQHQLIFRDVGMRRLQENRLDALRVAGSRSGEWMRTA